MHLSSFIISIISVSITLCNSQSYSSYRYPAQRRAGYSYTQPYNKRPTSYYPTSTNRNTVQSSSVRQPYNTYSSPATSSSYYQKTPQRTYKQTSSSSYPSSSYGQTYNPYRQQSSSINRNFVTSSSPSTGSRGSYGLTSSSSSFSGSRGPYASSSYNPQSSSINRNALQSSASSASNSKGTYSSASDPIPAKQYLTNSYNSQNTQNTTSSNTKDRVSKADSENAKFSGVDNQENEENDGRTLHLKRRKLQRLTRPLASPCFPFGRDAGNAVTPPPKEQGRFLWDVNVYNVYPQQSSAFASSSFGCGGGGFGGLAGVGGLGGIGGGGLLSDPIAQPYYPPGTGLANFLSIFAPGILQAATARPQLYSDSIQSQNDVQNDEVDPEVDPNYRPQQSAAPVRRPNRVYFDSMGAAPITPGQLLGGVSTTVNGIIQQLSGNVQPVYG